MKIQCDVCEKAPATLICCADEAALCAKCDVEIHAANKLASKHQRLLLNCLSDKLPRCDICQEKTAFIFCVEDRALFCKECDEPIHSPGSRSANHQRLLATGIRIGLSSPCTTKDAEPATNLEPPNQKAPPLPPNVKVAPSPQLLGYSSPSWAIDDFLQLQEFEPNDKKEAVGFGGLEWFSDIGLFDDGQMSHSQEGSAAAEVPQLPVPQAADSAHRRPSKSSAYSYKKARIEIADEEEYFTVPDLGRTYHACPTSLCARQRSLN